MILNENIILDYFFIMFKKNSEYLEKKYDAITSMREFIAIRHSEYTIEELHINLSTLYDKAKTTFILQ